MPSAIGVGDRAVIHERSRNVQGVAPSIEDTMRFHDGEIVILLIGRHRVVAQPRVYLPAPIAVTVGLRPTCVTRARQVIIRRQSLRAEAENASAQAYSRCHLCLPSRRNRFPKPGFRFQLNALW